MQHTTMDIMVRLFLMLSVCGLSLGLPLVSDTSVLELLIRLDADVKANKVKIQEMEETIKGSIHGKAALSSETPAFMATLSTRFDHCGENQRVVFDAVKLNQGGGYDYRHGLFRAPKNGTYQISATLTANASNVGYHVALVKNSVANKVGVLFADAGNDFWQIHSTSIIIHMNAGDDIWLSCQWGDSSIYGIQDVKSEYHFLSHFSGFMLSQD